MKEKAAAFFRELQDTICDGLSQAEGDQSQFQEDLWERPGGGGGRTRVLENGALFEKAGVNFSEVYGTIGPEMADVMPGDGATFYATGISLVLHPISPMIPTVHANFRYLSRGSAAWFGGGSDLTPYYLWTEDAAHFHQVWKQACDSYRPDAYAEFKAECDRYFHLAHREEARGIGGIFFDRQQDNLGETFEFVQRCGHSVLKAYLPIVERRRNEPWSETEKQWQQIRRGRYVEFNLIYDRGTLFGLKTNGRTESILMSLPPMVEWHYDHKPASGSREAELLECLKSPRNWV